MADGKIGYTFKGANLSPRGPKRRGRKIWVVLLLGALLVVAWWVFWRKPSAATTVGDEAVSAANAATKTAEGETDKLAPLSTVEEKTSEDSRPDPVPKVAAEEASTPKRLDESGRKMLNDVREAERRLAADEWLRARAIARKVVESGLPEGHPVWTKAVKILGAVNSRVFASDVPAPEKVLHTVESGDSLDGIAKKFGTTVEAIQRGNRLDPRSSTIYPGQQLRVHPGKWRIRIKKRRFKLYLYDGATLFKAYDIGIGKQGRTPVGTFDIVEKIKEPDWQYRGETIPYGTEGNVLGTRWMRLRPTGTTDANLQGYGIHGTWDPDSIGKRMSNGCVRLRNEDVNELYSIIPKYRDAEGEFVEVVIEE